MEAKYARRVAPTEDAEEPTQPDTFASPHRPSRLPRANSLRVRTTATTRNDPRRNSSLWFVLGKNQPRFPVGLPVVIWLLELLWNVTSPLRNYVLGRYEIGNSEFALTRGLEWWDELDGKYVSFLYQHAGINSSELFDGESLSEHSQMSRRVINVYINMLVLPIATQWAAGINQWHQDPLIGRYCQSGFREKRDRQWKQLEPIFATGEPFRLDKNEGPTRIISHFLPDQTTKCRLSEVPEAILCLKGYNATDLMNLEWSTGHDPTDPEVHHALAGWQSVLLPDLNQCLDRRKELVTTYEGDVASALLALADEMTANYSLSPYGWAGKLNLVAVYNQLEGYHDVNGQKAGKRTVSITGSITERNRNNYDGDIHAVSTIREAIWSCFYDPRNGTLYECFTGAKALTVSALFLGDQMNRMKSELLGSRYIQDSTLVQGKVYGGMRRWDYLPVQEPPVTAKYLPPGSNMSSGLETAYRDLIDLPLVFDIAHRSPRPNITTPALVLYKCIYEQGCGDLCVNNPDRDLAQYFVYVSKRSGICYKRRMDPELINRFGFVHRDCYGIGTGNHTLYFRINQENGPLYGWPNAPAAFEVNNVADPNSILACIMGGRLPQANANPFPVEFHDMVLLGTGMMQSVVFRDGSERTLLGIFTLISLLASIVYASMVIYEARFLYKMYVHVHKEFDPRTARQVLESILQMTLSFRVWRLNYPALSALGFFGILSWSVGVHGTMCTWFLEDEPLLGLDPETLDLSRVPQFQCRAGNVWGHLSSAFALLRLGAVAFVIQMILIGRRRFLGFSNYPVSYVVLELMVGVLPAVLTPFLVVGVNHLRLGSAALSQVHNQLVVGGVWVLCLLVSYEMAYRFNRQLYALVAPMGLRRMQVQEGSYRLLVAKEFVYRCNDDASRNCKSWIPLSILLEFLPQRELYALNFHLHCLDKTDSSCRFSEVQWKFSTRRDLLVLRPQADQLHQDDAKHTSAAGSVDQTATIHGARERIPQWVEQAKEFFVQLNDNI